jgi:hypothetical protein
MKTINNAEAQARARVNVTSPKKTESVEKARDIIKSIKNNPAYATTQKVQDCTNAFEAATNALDTNIVNVKSARSQLGALLATQLLLTADLRRTATTLQSVITDVARGSAEAIQQWGLQVAGRTPSSTEPTPPDGLKATYTKALQLVIRWKGVPGRLGYEIEMGDGTPTGWGQPIQVTKVRFTPTGLTPGQKVYFRVAVRRPSGLSDFSDPVVVTVR